MADRDIDDESQRWIDVLAGRSLPDDRDTQQASQLRDYFARRNEEEYRIEPAPEAEERLMQYLASKGVLPPRPETQATPARSGRLLEWLRSLMPQSTAAYGLAAALVLTVLALPVIMQIDPAGDMNMDTTYKGGTNPAGTASARTVAVLDAHPAAEAEHLAALLASFGVKAVVLNRDGVMVVQAQLPAESAPAIRQALAEEGIVIDTHIDVAIEVRQLP